MDTRRTFSWKDSSLEVEVEGFVLLPHSKKVVSSVLGSDVGPSSVLPMFPLVVSAAAAQDKPST